MQHVSQHDTSCIHSTCFMHMQTRWAICINSDCDSLQQAMYTVAGIPPELICINSDHDNLQQAMHCLQGISPELHRHLVSQVGEDIFAGRAMLALELLPASFLQSCTQCARFFAKVQDQVGASHVSSIALHTSYPACMLHCLYDAPCLMCPDALMAA